MASSPLARSLIWPKQDLTVKSLPKNFSIVFALAGDSTITKLLLIFYLFLTPIMKNSSTRIVSLGLQYPNSTP